jgi:hypothetical protein
MRMMSVDVPGGNALGAAAPQPLFEARSPLAASQRTNYVVSHGSGACPAAAPLRASKPVEDADVTPLTYRHGVLTGLAVAALVWVSSTLVQAQNDEARRRAEQELARAAGGKVYSGADIGFRARGFDRDRPLVVPVVKVNGEWVEVQLGVPGIRKLTN